MGPAVVLGCKAATIEHNTVDSDFCEAGCGGADRPGHRLT